MDTVVTPAAHAAAFWASLHLFLMLILAMRVVRQRQTHKVLIGDDGVPELQRARRAFGNASEYAPAGIAALAVLALAGAPPAVVHGVGGALFIGRVAHAVGLSLNAGVSLGRSVGTALTWLAYLFAAVLLLFYAF
jgi:uncharacterized membrane protein YecN with MAPEG domain